MSYELMCPQCRTIVHGYSPSDVYSSLGNHRVMVHSGYLDDVPVKAPLENLEYKDLLFLKDCGIDPECLPKS